VRQYDILTDTSQVLACATCGGTGLVQAFLVCPEVKVSGTIHVVNPGDPGYEEARQRMLAKATNKNET